MKDVKLTVAQIAEMLSKTKIEVSQMTYTEIDKAVGAHVQIVSMSDYYSHD